MKHVILLFAIICAFSSCQSYDFELDQQTEENAKTKKFTFTIKGDFDSPTFTRGYLQADGKDMSDLWVLDYMDGLLVQELHLTPSDEAWGAPKMSLKYGSHHVYFVASRGADAVKDNDAHTITWGTVRDTFWKDYEVDVVSTSNGNRAVMLDRVATKLRLQINDEVPANIYDVAVTPETWYYGLDWLNGSAVSAQRKVVRMDVPASYVGTKGKLAATLYGISPATEWTTSVALAATDASSQLLGSVTIADVPLLRNRATEYSGNLFGDASAINIVLDSDWQSPVSGVW